MKKEADNSRLQKQYAAAWSDYLASEATPLGHLVTGHVAALLAQDQGGADAAHAIAVIDLGCGAGALFDDLKAAGVAFGSYLGIDANPVLIGKARAHGRADANFAVADLADPSGRNEALNIALGGARPEKSVYVLVRVLNYLPDEAAAALLETLAERAPGALTVILDVYSGQTRRPHKDDPLGSEIERETFGGVDITHHVRDPFQYVDFLSALKLSGLSARAAYLRGPAAPSHFTVSGRFRTRP